MARPTLAASAAVALLLVTSLAGLAAADKPGGGDDARRSTGGMTSYDSDRTIAAQQLVASAIADAATSLHASLAAAVGSKAALLATDEGAGLGELDAAARSSGGARRLLQGGGGGKPGNGGSARRSVGGTTWYDAGDRTINALQHTSDAIAKAAASLHASLATAVGTKAALLSTAESTGQREFDSAVRDGGARRLLQDPERPDSAWRDSPERVDALRWSAPRLAAEAVDGGARRLLQQSALERSDRASLGLTAAQDAIRQAVSADLERQQPQAAGQAGSAKAAASSGLLYARLASQESALPSDFALAGLQARKP
ncbi:hypothetical protein HT031_000929 [Scenedesmus sp. PABB004]|nr:hypothetical protein HT031_006945 [Scenedesmus sp. PABB004]KAF8054747.1 hypothetical protein HT031_006946 [Scenedesmus sp. PABB004]KAF8054748.1 hypothetical protein HT031_006947 [Scenedesmus sp. PABB004]KAF8054749.1 hypothetical protein HT031_006948 [Scenedesmus sp. PABB004]KAF8054750.1 hypothetical protein HT031_006949 [Scenedesmus sp. PABB004]